MQNFTSQQKLVSIIIPCYNEAQGLGKSVKKLVGTLPESYLFEIILIDDGSTDNTLQIMKQLAQDHKFIQYLSFSRNFGQQAAIKSGFDYCKGDCAITMDADLQHPPELINLLLKHWEEGYDIVYTIRLEDKKLPLAKRISSYLFYKIMNYLSEVEIKKGSADFRLIDRKVLRVFRDQITENNLFVRGLVSWVGFKQKGITYFPNERMSGETKYSLRKMINLAIDGVTSFSVKPIRLAIYIGLFIILSSLVYIVYLLYSYFYLHNNIAGWTSTVLCILTIGGIQIFILGILGEYLGKIFIEVKDRPTYIIKDKSL